MVQVGKGETKAITNTLFLNNKILAEDVEDSVSASEPYKNADDTERRTTTKRVTTQDGVKTTINTTQ